jgi:hypothetical protein
MRTLLTALAAGTLFTASVSGQVSTGEIIGTITDASGGAVANAKITASNAATGVSRQTAAGENTGDYIITLLPPGTYTISVEAAGFRKAVQNDVTLQVNQRLRLDVALQVGQVSETVEVNAAPPLLESQSSSVGSVISQQFVSELPLNGRNFVQLAILTPGVNGTGYSVGGTIQSGARPDDRRPGTEIFSNGNREGSNNFLYDGVDNNERLIQLIVLRPAIESIREFKVQTNMYSADVGRNSGAVVDVVTKSGTNQIHGSVFEFLRNSGMDARSYFNARGTAFPPFGVSSETVQRQEPDVLLRGLGGLSPQHGTEFSPFGSHGQDPERRLQRRTGRGVRSFGGTQRSDSRHRNPAHPVSEQHHPAQPLGRARGAAAGRFSAADERQPREQLPRQSEPEAGLGSG